MNGITGNTRKSIFFIINSLYGGGAEHAASRIVRLLSEKYDVVVIALYPRTAKDFEFGEKVISVYDPHDRGLWFGRIRTAAGRIDELAERYRPKAMISFLQNANLCLMLTKYKARKIISIRVYLEELFRGLKGFIWRQLIRIFFRRADKIVSVSEMINDEMKNVYRMPPEKCTCIYNMYDIDEIAEDSRESLEAEYRDFYEKHIVISSMGRVSEQKGHFHLVRILNELNRSEKRFGLVIIGYDKDPYAKKVKKLALAYNLQDDVLFTGHEKNPYKYIRNSMCFVLPSRYEGFPNALVEAMICQVPVISSDCRSGPREILMYQNERYGFLVKSEQEVFLEADKPLTEMEKQITDIIRHLRADDGYRRVYAEKSFMRAKDFSAERIIGEWHALIDS